MNTCERIVWFMMLRRRIAFIEEKHTYKDHIWSEYNALWTAASINASRQHHHSAMLNQQILLEWIYNCTNTILLKSLYQQLFGDTYP